MQGLCTLCAKALHTLCNGSAHFVQRLCTICAKQRLVRRYSSLSFLFRNTDSVFIENNGAKLRRNAEMAKRNWKFIAYQPANLCCFIMTFTSRQSFFWTIARQYSNKCITLCFKSFMITKKKSDFNLTLVVDVRLYGR